MSDAPDPADRERRICALADAGLDRRAIAAELGTRHGYVARVLQARYWQRVASAAPAPDPAARIADLEARSAALQIRLAEAEAAREQVVAENRVLRRALTWERCKRRATPAPALPATARHDWRRDVAERWYTCTRCGLRAYEPHTVQLDCATVHDRRRRRAAQNQDTTSTRLRQQEGVR